MLQMLCFVKTYLHTYIELYIYRTNFALWVLGRDGMANLLTSLRFSSNKSSCLRDWAWAWANNNKKHRVYGEKCEHIKAYIHTFSYIHIYASIYVCIYALVHRNSWRRLGKNYWEKYERQKPMRQCSPHACTNKHTYSHTCIQLVFFSCTKSMYVYERFCMLCR